MDAGELLPDDVMIGIVERAARPATTPSAGATSSTASPAPCAQAEALIEITQRAADRPGDRPRGARARWCSQRLAAGGSATTAAPTTRSPRLRSTNWTCDVCGGDVVQRDDDTEEAINRRLDLYESQTAPLDRVLRGPATCSRSVDGVGSADDVLAPARADDRAGRPSRRGRRADLSRCVRTSRRPAGDDAQGRPGRGRDARPHPGGDPPGRHDRRPRPDRPRGARAPRRPVELPRLPRLPGGDLRFAQRRDRPRHPRWPRCWRRATSSRSTAGRSSTAGTATPRSPPPVGQVGAEAAAADRGHRGQPSAPASRQMVDGHRLSDIGHAVQEVAEGGRVLGRAGVRRPRHRHGHARAARGPELRAARHGARSCGPGNVFAVEPMVNAGGPDDPAARRRLERW